MLRDEILAGLGRLGRSQLLIRTLVARELKARYRGSFLGFLWSFLNPLLLMLIYTLVFSVYMRVEEGAIGGPYPVFLFCGLLPWIWFSSAVIEGASSIITGGGLVNKALFPAEILPTVSVLSNLVHFCLGFPILLGFLVVFGRAPGVSVVLLPLLLLVQFLFTWGVVLALATASVYFRDLQQILANLMTLWFFLTPVLYPPAAVPPAFRFTLYANPVAPLISSYQDILFYGRWPVSPLGLTVVGLVAVLAAAVGYAIFLHSRDEFPEEV